MPFRSIYLKEHTIVRFFYGNSQSKGVILRFICIGQSLHNTNYAVWVPWLEEDRYDT